jgi:carboxyl-terminal processing protease
MKRRLLFGFVTVALMVNLVIGAAIYISSADASEKDTAYPNLKLFAEVMERVRKDYVDGEGISYQELIYAALQGMIGKLDPHSEFLDPQKYQDLQHDTQGSFGGLGIVIGMKESFITVIAPMEDTPGSRAGILSGDRIIKINGLSTENMGLPDAVKHLRGAPGTPVTVTLQRPSSGKIDEYTLKRETINVDMIKDINGRKEFPLGENRIGYIRIVQFGEKTSEDLDLAIRKLKAQGMQALVLDLRWNPGGLLEQAVEVCQKFLPRGQLVVTTEGRHPGQTSARRAGGRGDELVNADGTRMPIVVLVNLGSASASEIVAGCLQDLGRAMVLGENTFGKGSVQSIFPLAADTALRLTTAKYYTPSHKVIHEVGITPNILVPLTEEEERDIVLRRTPGGIDTLDEQDRERVRNSRDPQLDRANDLLKGILLFAQRAPEKLQPADRKMAMREQAR